MRVEIFIYRLFVSFAFCSIAREPNYAINPIQSKPNQMQCTYISLYIGSTNQLAEQRVYLYVLAWFLRVCACTVYAGLREIETFGFRLFSERRRRWKNGGRKIPQIHRNCFSIVFLFFAIYNCYTFWCVFIGFICCIYLISGANFIAHRYLCM